MKNDIQKAIDEQKPEVKEVKKPKLRQLILETDGQNINISKQEWTQLEMVAGLSMLLNKFNGR